MSEPRRYRFRLLSYTGPSRFYEFFLTDLRNLSATNPYWLIGTDGNLLPNPIQIKSVRIGPAERVDVIIDFRNFAGRTIYLENRLNQLSGQGPAAIDSQVAAQNASSTECSLVLKPACNSASWKAICIAVQGQLHQRPRRKRRSSNQAQVLSTPEHQRFTSDRENVQV